MQVLASAHLGNAHSSATVCHGHNWRWYNGESCGARTAAAGLRHKYEEEKRALLSATTRTVFFTSLTYGGTDQMTVSTVHLARELNILNMACDTLQVGAVRVRCPIAFVAPVVRDLTPSAKKDSMYLFSEPSRKEVPFGALFDTEDCYPISVSERLNLGPEGSDHIVSKASGRTARMTEEKPWNRVLPAMPTGWKAGGRLPAVQYHNAQ